MGRLTWSAIPLNQPLPMLASSIIILGFLAAGVIITRKHWWSALWGEWLTSVDHKRIGVMYVLLGCILLLRGFIDALMMRSQQALATGGALGYLPPEHYDQIFTAHGTIMIFFVAMPLVVGLMNFVVPLQLGVRDVAFPVLNSVELLADRLGRLAGQHVAVGGRIRPHRLARLSAAVGIRSTRRMSGSTTTSGHCRSRAWAPCMSGINLVDDHPQDARAGHELHAHAGVLLDGVGLEPADRRRVSDPDGDVRRCCCSIATCGFHFFTNDGRRQRHDVHQPDLGLGPSGGLHPDPAGLRRVLRSGRDLLAASRCSATARWCWRPWRSAFSRSWSGCIISSPWAPAPTSTLSSASRP